MLSGRVDELKTKISASTAVTDSSVLPKLSVKVNVSVSDELQGKVPENGVLFVFAKADNGPPMPLAVVRKQHWTLPLQVSLSELDAMVDGMSFQQFKQVRVFARVSLDDKVDIQTGELEGNSDGFDIEKTEQVNVIIDTLLH